MVVVVRLVGSTVMCFIVGVVRDVIVIVSASCQGSRYCFMHVVLCLGCVCVIVGSVLMCLLVLLLVLVLLCCRYWCYCC